MKQNFQFQQKQGFQFKDHPQEPALFWCKQAYCQVNRVFCLVCQKEKKHIQHFNEDVHGFHELLKFLSEKSKYPKDLISECQNQFGFTIKSFDKLTSSLSYKFCGLEDIINKLQNYQILQVLDSFVQFDEIRKHTENNIIAYLKKFQKILDDLYNLLELHLIKYQMIEEQITVNQNELQKGLHLFYDLLGISLNIRNKQIEALQIFDKLLLDEPYNIEIMYQKGNSLKKQLNVRFNNLIKQDQSKTCFIALENR
ncbi:unnamed protein product [Paramecium sonneborni]|uniref:Uncharacterized protein n=1 Tax=Paramecium sonneborni TaxID=65129 RepID=A0A8S1MWR4_9CILI|nr:unnamed protein product [Paramecium sonneborni]